MDNKNKDYIFCSNCGSQNSTISSFCANCGSEMIKANQNTDKNDTPNIVTETINSNKNDYSDNSDILEFVSQNTDFYDRKFQLMMNTDKKVTWNWPAFLLGIYWLLYRKMYLQAGGIFLLGMVVSFVPYIGPIIGILIPFALGMFGNYLYLNHVQSKLREINYSNTYSKDEAIARKGGVNLVVPIAILVIQIIIFVLIYSFFYAMFSVLFY